MKNNSSFDCELMVKYGAVTILLRKEWHRLVKDPLGFKLEMNSNHFINELHVFKSCNFKADFVPTRPQGSEQPGSCSTLVVFTKSSSN